MRLEIVDGFRGFFLFFMMVTHVQGLVHAPWGVFNHHHFGWVEDAQGFVFLSGLVVGMVYGRRLIGRGEAAMAAAIRARVGLIWRHHAALVLMALAMLAVLPALGLWSDYLRPMAEHPLVFAAASLALLTGTIHMGILPMYIWFMLATPWVLRAFRAGHAATVAAVSATLWFLAQTSLPDQLQLPLEAALAAAGAPINIGIYFNVLAWQVLFLAGLWFGWLSAAGRLDLSWLKTPEAGRVFAVMVALWLILGVFDVLAYTRVMPDRYNDWVFSRIDRGNLEMLYLVAAANALYLAAWLVIAAPVSGGRLARAVSRGLGWAMTRGPLVLLGRHSLAVFSAHVVLVYALSVALWGVEVQEIPEGWRNLILYASTLPLFAVAWIGERGWRRAPAAAG